MTLAASATRMLSARWTPASIISSYKTGHQFQSFPVVPGDDFHDIFEPVLPISGIDAFRRIANFKIRSAGKSRFRFQCRDANLVRHPRIDGGFVNDDRSPSHHASDEHTRVSDESQIGHVAALHRGWDGHNNALGLPQPLRIRREFNAALLNRLVSDIAGNIPALTVSFDFSRIHVKPDDLGFLGEGTRSAVRRILSRSRRSWLGMM